MEPDVPLAPEAEDIPDEPAPLAPTEDIPDEPTPLAPEEPEEDVPVVNWALINLIMMIVAIAFAVIAIIGAVIRRNKDDRNIPEEQKKPAGAFLTGMIIAIGAAIASVIAFVLTEDLSGVMQMVDQWTVLMVILGAVAVVFTCISGRGAKKPGDKGIEG